MENFQEMIVIREINKYESRLTDFVHNVYLAAFAKYGWRGDYEAIREDDLEFFALSTTFIAVGEITNNIYGTVKAIYKDQARFLPVERDFGIRCEEIIQQHKLPAGKIIEVARFATDHLICQQNNKPHKEVTIALLKKICEECRKKSILYSFASIDERVWQWLVREGFNFEQIGEIKVYIGSPTVPVFLPIDKLPM
jgi:N-acyl-L-homoserine lactone synthetase